MVDTDALRIASLVAIGLVLVLLGGQALQIVGQLVTWALLAGIVVAGAYAAYELYAGWSEAGDDLDERGFQDDLEEHRLEENESEESQSEDGHEGAIPDAEQRTIEAVPIDPERELEQLRSNDGASDLQPDRER